LGGTAMVVPLLLLGGFGHGGAESGGAAGSDLVDLARELLVARIPPLPGRRSRSANEREIGHSGPGPLVRRRQVGVQKRKTQVAFGRKNPRFLQRAREGWAILKI
jgi:hypothetical protein